jgi:hypothetical protein
VASTIPRGMSDYSYLNSLLKQIYVKALCR